MILLLSYFRKIFYLLYSLLLKRKLCQCMNYYLHSNLLVKRNIQVVKQVLLRLHLILLITV
nr:MAG TPA: hypothetical protein [Crassvirales sp.]DAP79220.1 MAG TPA: hypothetical protein [Caudoviricetes sp.]